MLASWLFHCDDLGEALRVFQRHIALMNPSESWMLDVDGDSLSLTISFAPGKAYPRAAVERSMTALTTWARELTGVPLVPTACEFAFSRPPYLASYTGIFGPNMGFDCDRNCIRLPQEILRRPIRSANSYLKQILEERARQALEKLEGESELIDKVRQRILSNLHLGLSIEEVCNALHVSRPTLYRRLKREGTVTRN